MTKYNKNKILVVDDVLERLSILKESINYDFVKFSENLSDFIEVNQAGTKFQEKFNKEEDDYEYIFIHHSFDNPKQSSNAINLLQKNLNNITFVTFSGESSNEISKNKLSRDVFYERLNEFCVFGLKYNFDLIVFTGVGYKKKYLKSIFEKITFNEGFELEKNYTQLCELLDIKEDTFKRFENINRFKSLLKDKIEEL